MQNDTPNNLATPQPPAGQSRPRSKKTWLIVTIVVSLILLLSAVGVGLYIWLSQVSDETIMDRAKQAATDIQTYQVEFNSTVTGRAPKFDNSQKQYSLQFQAKDDVIQQQSDITYTTGSTGRLAVTGQVVLKDQTFYQRIIAPPRAKGGWKVNNIGDRKLPVITNMRKASLVAKNLLSDHAAAITTIERQADGYELVFSGDEDQRVREVFRLLIANQLAIQGLNDGADTNRQATTERFDVRLKLNQEYQPESLEAKIDVVVNDAGHSVRASVDQRIIWAKVNQPADISNPDTNISPEVDDKMQKA